jgi:glycosyltransferase involved in cell wall biosynthesis
MIVAFCIPQFKRANFPLQPWLTIHRVAKNLSDQGHSVHVITDEGVREEFDGIKIDVVSSLRGTNSRQIGRLLQAIKPNSVIATITPLSLATAGWYQILDQYSAYGYISYPFYSVKQILKAFPYLGWNDRWEYGRHLVVPRRIWTNRLVRYFKGVICQSRYTAKKMETLTKCRIPAHVIPPGIDKDVWAFGSEQKRVSPEAQYLYLGAASRIRGLFLLLKAFTILSTPEIKLKVLSRGADENSVKNLQKEAKRLNIAKQVSMRGGWIKPDELKRQIRSAAAVLFPFILVPSELPVSVMEAIYCGTPVIVSNLVGLSEVVGRAGIVVPHADVKKMASAIQALHQHREYQDELNAQCYEQRNTIMSWDSVCKIWADFLTH